MNAICRKISSTYSRFCDKKDKKGNTPLDLAEKSIIDEEEAYQKAMKEQSQYYIPSRESVVRAIEIRDILKGRIKGGI